MASTTQLLLFTGLPVALVLGAWGRSDLDRADPVRIGVIALASAASWWAALVWQGSVRGMVRHLSSPRRPHDEDDDED